MKYDRLTRLVKFEVGGEEYAARLTIGMLEEIEDILPKGVTLVNLFLNNEMPQIKVLRKAFCVGLMKDGQRVKNALPVFEQYCNENGVQSAVQVFYALVAASYMLGAEVSKSLLESMELEVKDEDPKNE